MNTESRVPGTLRPSRAESRPWLRTVMLASRLYGLAALCYIWIDIQLDPGRLRPMGAPILVPALFLGYILSLSALSAVGLRQLRSGARRQATLNLGLTALTRFLGCCAFYLIDLEGRKWLQSNFPLIAKSSPARTTAPIGASRSAHIPMSRSRRPRGRSEPNRSPFIPQCAPGTTADRRPQKRQSGTDCIIQPGADS